MRRIRRQRADLEIKGLQGGMSLWRAGMHAWPAQCIWQDNRTSYKTIWAKDLHDLSNEGLKELSPIDR